MTADQPPAAVVMRIECAHPAPARLVRKRKPAPRRAAARVAAPAVLACPAALPAPPAPTGATSAGSGEITGGGGLSWPAWPVLPALQVPPTPVLDPLPPPTPQAWSWGALAAPSAPVWVLPYAPAPVVPEPQSWAMLLAGVLLGALVRTVR